MNEILEILQHVKDNPGCSSEGLNSRLVVQLIEDQEFLEGIVSQELGVKETYVSNIYIKIEGSLYLKENTKPNIPKVPKWAIWLLAFLMVSIIAPITVNIITAYLNKSHATTIQEKHQLPPLQASEGSS